MRSSSAAAAAPVVHGGENESSSLSTDSSDEIALIEILRTRQQQKRDKQMKRKEKRGEGMSLFQCLSGSERRNPRQLSRLSRRIDVISHDIRGAEERAETVGIEALLSFSPDGRWLCSGDTRNGRLRLRRSHTLTRTDTQQVPPELLSVEEAIASLAWGPVETAQLAVGHRTRACATIFDIETLQCLRTLRSSGRAHDGILELSFLPGTRNMCCGGSLLGSVYVWDLRSSSRRPWKTLERDCRIHALIPFSSSRGLLSCHRNGSVSVWDMRYSPVPVRSFNVLEKLQLNASFHGIDSAVFLPDSSDRHVWLETNYAQLIELDLVTRVPITRAVNPKLSDRDVGPRCASRLRLSAFGSHQLIFPRGNTCIYGEPGDGLRWRRTSVRSDVLVTAGHPHLPYAAFVTTSLRIGLLGPAGKRQMPSLVCPAPTQTGQETQPLR